MEIFALTPAPIVRLLENRWFGLLARITLTFPYWTSGIAKLLNLKGALAEAHALGLHPAVPIIAVTIFVELGASLAVISSRLTWLAAGALGVFTAIAAAIAYPFWADPDTIVRFTDRNAFFEHIGLIGGCVLASILADREHRQ